MTTTSASGGGGSDGKQQASTNMGEGKRQYYGDGRPPTFTLRKVGIGAGTKDFYKHPNIVRLMLGDDIVTK